jgi:hypothetical protein
MSIKEDIKELTETLKQQRDALSLKMHLAEMDAKEEWEKAEKVWDKFSAKANDIFDEAVETSDDFVDAAKVVGEELKSAYKRIKDRM